MQTKYAFEKFSQDMARAYGRSLDISLKASINICSALRGKDAAAALVYLDEVIAKQRAVPFRRFTDGVGHRRGKLAAGRYPFKAAKSIRSIVAAAVANAANKGLAEELSIVHICAHKASTPFHQGRQRRQAMKRTHIEVVLQEKEADQDNQAKQPVQKKNSALKQQKKVSPSKKQSSFKQAQDKKPSQQPQGEQQRESVKKEQSLSPKETQE